MSNDVIRWARHCRETLFQFAAGMIDGKEKDRQLRIAESFLEIPGSQSEMFGTEKEGVGE